MWFVAGILDKQSNYSDIDEDPSKPYGQYRAISKDLDGDENWLYENYERLAPLFDAWGRYADTEAWRLMRSWEAKMKERTKILDETSYVIGVTDATGKYIGSNVDMLDKMLERSQKLWDSYHKYNEMISAEGDTDGTVKGDSIESASDKGLV